MVIWKNRVRIIFLLLGIVAMVSLAACGGSKKETSKAPAGGDRAAKQAAAKTDFPAKDVTYVVPVSPGGGYDTYSRILAPFLEKNLPKKVNVVVKNVPGGEWRLGISEIYKAKPDGYTLGIFNIPGNVVSQIMGTSDFDLNKITWIGRMTDTVYVAALSPKSKIKTLDDMKKADVVKAGVVGLSSTAGLSALITAQEIGFKLNPINHDGSQEAILSAIRGDVDLVIYPYPTLDKFIVGSKDLTPIWVYADKRLPALPDVPTITEVGYPKLLDTVRMDYLVGATPGLPDDVAKIWRDAFQKAMADPDLQTMMKDAKQPANPTADKKAAEIIKNSISGFEKYKDLIAKYSTK